MNHHHHHHVLIISQHPHGHLNPCIQLALNLTRAGARATLATTVSGFHKLQSLPPHHRLSIASFSDGHDNDPNAAKSPDYVPHLKRVGSKTIAGLIQTLADSGDKVTSIVYTLFIPWVATVAREFNVPSALLLIQNATSFSIYNRFFNRHDGIFVTNDKHTDHTDTSDALFSLKLPGLPEFKRGDIPTFALPTSPFFPAMKSVIQEHLQFLEENPSTHILVNTLDGLEPDSVESLPNAIVVGPLVVSSSFSGDDVEHYFQWLDSKAEKSVVFVSFGSMAVLTKTQKLELLHGLIDSHRPFLLVLREGGENDEEEDVEIKKLIDEVGDQGLVVGWCYQTEVLRHRAIGCFVTHCGWNSTVESMVAGVAVVGYPQFADQTANAKMVEEVWRNGVRMVVDEAMVVRREEICRCLTVVMDGGDRAEEIRKMVEKWRSVAEESVKDGGSAVVNLKMFLGSIL